VLENCAVLGDDCVGVQCKGESDQRRKQKNLDISHDRPLDQTSCGFPHMIESLLNVTGCEPRVVVVLGL
jgi:hypothetical protein